MSTPRATTFGPRLGIVACLVGLALSAAGQDAGDDPAAADPPAPRTDIKLRNVRWQSLPADVQAAFVGPDQRVWYMVDRQARAGKADEPIKRVIEREFDQPAPQIVQARPILFERGGRVWFTAIGSGHVLGYDGKAWVEHDPNALAAVKRNAPHRVVAGSPPGHGRWYRQGTNFQIGDTLFFAGDEGVTTYDTKAGEWDHQAMSARAGDIGQPAPPVLFPTPDDKGLLAYVARPEPALWQWRDGKWAPRPLPWPADAGRAVVAAFTDEGAWVRPAERTLTFYTFDGRPPAGFDALVAALSADAFKDREAASAALASMGSAVRPWLEAARNQPGLQPEPALRIDGVLRKLAEAKRVSIGPMTVDVVDGLRPIDRRHVLITALDLSGGRGRASHAFVAGPGGRVVEIDPGVARGTPFADASETLAGYRPDHAWLAQADGAPAELVDLKTGQVAARLPAGRFNYFHAARADGTLFVSPAAPTQGPSGRPVMVFRPDAPDDRVTLKSTATPAGGAAFCVAADGSVWASRPDGGLARFDGKAWQPVTADLAGGPAAARQGQSFAALIPGANREVLVRSGGGASLVLGDRAVSAKTIEALIEANRDRIAAAFPATWARAAAGRTLRLFADPAGNVWLVEGIRWKVLTRAGWVEGAAALKAAGATGASNEVVEPLGDGSRVYLSDFTPGNVAGGLIAEVRDGKVVLARAEGASQLGLFHRPIRGADGALYKSGYPMQRVTGQGKVENLDAPGVPKMCDADGNLWVTQDAGPAAQVTLRRGGKVVQTLAVPDLSQDTTFFADRPGSAYAWNAAGLHRFVAGKDGAYRFAGTYAIDDLPHVGADPQVSSLGYLVATTLRTTGGAAGGYAVVLVELPKE